MATRMNVPDPGERSAEAGSAHREARVLFVEDVPAEVDIVTHHLRKGGVHCVWKRVDTEEGLRESLGEFRPTIILSDFSLPRFDGLSALRVAHEGAPEIPFIFVSGTIGEECAIQALKSGAVDYVLKTNLKRLVPAVTRALDEAAARDQRRQQEAQIARLTRVLRMLSGINGMVIRIRDRNELLDEACRHAVKFGGYTSALVVLRQTGTGAIEPVAWTGLEDPAGETRRASVERVFETGAVSVDARRSHVVLPLIIDNTTVGAFLLTAPDAGTVGPEELQMLHEVAANLSFALQYLQKDSAVRFLSYFDPHTGLAKRTLFCERLQRLMARAGRPAKPAVAVVDIEHLSVINDSFGRHMGDLLLQHVADRLRRHFRDTEMLAQMGGGTFAIALDASAHSRDPMEALHSHLDAVFSHPFEMEGRLIPVVVKSGLAVHPDDGKDAEALVQNAEAALRNARRTGQRNLHYRAEHHSSVVARLALEHKMRTALKQRQFELYYQPKVSVATGCIDGAEALIRWRDPDSGPVSPAEFLPVLESTGLISEVGHWVAEQAAKDCEEWRRAGLMPVRVAVNLSPVQLRRPDFAERFLELGGKGPGGRCGLDVEITEGALGDDSAAEIGKLEQLRNAGVCIAIDDFGTGYSSLSRLSELPIDTLKIDRSFINRLPDDRAGRTLVSTIIALAHAFHMRVVAEGVETQAQFAALRDLGCDQVQGYLFSKPVPRDAFMQLLQRGKERLMA
jgi:diguanylate cyclase (GGDEF)-like protein